VAGDLGKLQKTPKTEYHPLKEENRGISEKNQQ